MKINLTCVHHHTFLSAPLRSGAVVFDCGANRGHFGRAVADAYRSTVFAFEADPTLARDLLPAHHYHPFPYAITARNGSLALGRTTAGSTSTTGFLKHVHKVTDVVEVPARSIDSLCDELGIDQITLLKLDIEGAELEVLEEIPPSRLSRICQITCEFHDFLDREQVPRIKNVLQRLRACGFYVIPMSFWTYGDVLCVNTTLLPLSPLQKLRMQVHKFRAGFSRIMRRLYR